MCSVLFVVSALGCPRAEPTVTVMHTVAEVPEDFEAGIDLWPPAPRPEQLIVLTSEGHTPVADTVGPELAAANSNTIQAQTGHINGFDYLEAVVGDASPDAELPLIVFLHGRGDRPRVPGGALSELTVPVRLFIPRAPDPLGDGYTWLATYTRSEDEMLLARSVSATAASLASAITSFSRARRTRGRPIIIGFSQGGILTYALATLHPHLVEAAFPIAGFLPAVLIPAERPERSPRIWAFHGDADRTVPFEHGVQTVSALRDLGYRISLDVAPGVAHTVSEDTNRLIRERLATLVRML